VLAARRCHDSEMSDFRVVRRLATWWQCAILIAFDAGLGWIVQMGLQSTNSGPWIRVLIPPYALLLYATLAALINRRSVIVTPEHLKMDNAPIPLGEGRELIPRDKVAFVYYYPVTTISDGGDHVVLWHTCGIETRDGRDVEVFGSFNDAESAHAAARHIADAFGAPGNNYSIPVRSIGALRDHSADNRTGWIWAGCTIAALAVGTVWAIAKRP
jgi:hypothetical protein